MNYVHKVHEKFNGIRICQMTLGMVEEVSSVHMEAFKGGMNTRLGKPYVRQFLSWFVRMPKAITLVAILHYSGKNEIVGYVVGAPSDYGKAMNRDLFWIACLSVCLKPWNFFSRQFRSTVIARLKSMFTIMPDNNPKVDLPLPIMSLVGIGVASNYQGQNIGKELLRSFEEKARALHVRSLRLSVYPDNSAARHIYEKSGWVPCQSSVRQGFAMNYFRIL